MAEIVYVLFNASMPTLSRVGVLGEETPAELMARIYTENIPLPYACVYAATVKDAAQAEAAVYERFAERKLGRYGDFDGVTPDRLVEVLRPYEVDDVTERFSADFDSELDDDAKDARARFTAKRPPGKWPTRGTD
jgi:hypothetical protein